MSNVVRIRVEGKSGPGIDREKAFRALLHSFNKRVKLSGILTKYKEKLEYESKGQKRRRKTKEAALNQLKDVEYEQ